MLRAGPLDEPHILVEPANQRGHLSRIKGSTTSGRWKWTRGKHDEIHLAHDAANKRPSIGGADVNAAEEIQLAVDLLRVFDDVTAHGALEDGTEGREVADGVAEDLVDFHGDEVVWLDLEGEGS